MHVQLLIPRIITTSLSALSLSPSLSSPLLSSPQTSVTLNRQKQTDDAKTTRPNLRDLANNIRTTKWFELGLQLTGNVRELDLIGRNHKNDARSALLDMLGFVLKEDPELSWEKVTDALQTIDERNMAKTIHDKFCKH